MRNAFLPLALVVAPVVPAHLSLSVSEVVPELSSVYVAVRPLKASLSVLLVLRKAAFVVIALRACPGALSLSQSLHELSFVGRAVLPAILSWTVGVTVAIRAVIGVSVAEVFAALAFLDEPAEEA